MWRERRVIASAAEGSSLLSPSASAVPLADAPAEAEPEEAEAIPGAARAISPGRPPAPQQPPITAATRKERLGRDKDLMKGYMYVDTQGS